MSSEIGQQKRSEPEQELQTSNPLSPNQPKKRQKTKAIDEELALPVNTKMEKEVRSRMTGRIRRQKANITDTPTRPEGKPFEVYTNEKRCAAYLGFRDIKDYRLSRFSPPLLQALLSYRASHCTKGQYKEALLLILDDKEAITRQIEADDGHVREERESLSKARQLATILVQLERDLQRFKTLNSIDRMKELQNLFNPIKEIARSDISCLHISMENIIMPILGPHSQFNEHPLEKFARLWNFLMSLDLALAASRFKSTFITSKQPFGSNLLSPSDKPSWMSSDEHTFRYEELSGPTPPRRHLRIEMQCDVASSVAYNPDDEETHEPGLEWPHDKFGAISWDFSHDPYNFPIGGMWRDELKRHLKMPSIGADFRKMEYRFPDTMEDVFIPVWKPLYDAKGKLAVDPWRSFNIELAKEEHVIIGFSIEPAQGLGYWGMEDNEYPWEYIGPPRTLANDITLDKDGDVAPVFNESGQPIHPPLIEEAQAEIAEMNVEQFQAFLRQGGADRPRQRCPRPEERFQLPREMPQFLKYYGGYDVRQPDQYRKWLSEVLDEVIGQTGRPQVESKTGSVKIDRRHKKALGEIGAELEADALTHDVDKRKANVQAAFHGTNTYTGPRVDHAREVLDMEDAQFLEGPKGDRFARSKTRAFDCKQQFLDAQISAAVWMLAKTYERIPIDNKREQSDSLLQDLLADSTSLKDILDGPECRLLPTYGGIYADATGMGKTATTLLFLAWVAQFDEVAYTSTEAKRVAENIKHGKSSNPQPYIHRPHLVLAPSGNVLIQWADLIADNFPTLQLLIAFGEEPPKPRYDRSFLSSAAMREYVSKKDPATLKHWPPSFRYMFDVKDPKASHVVLLSTYDTFSDRTMITETITDSISARTTKEFTNRWKNTIRTVICDEGHRLRHKDNRTHSMVKSLHADYYWFLTATPVINSIFDVLGPIEILWRNMNLAMWNTTDSYIWAKQQEQKGIGGFQNVITGGFTETDPRRYLLLEPSRVEHLLSTKNVKLLSETFPFIDQIVCLKRSHTSPIRLDDTHTQSLQSLIPEYHVKTQLLEYRGEEKDEAQWIHRLHARGYVDAIKGCLHRYSKKQTSSFPNTSQHLRRLCITSASTKLGRFDLRLRAHGVDSTVANIDRIRQKGANLDWFIALVHTKGEPWPQTHKEKIAYLCQGAPKGRVLLQELRDYIGPQMVKKTRDKILFGEDTVPVAWFWELILSSLFINATVMHAGLSHQERIEIVANFNNPENDLVALISMYGVTTQGTNFHQACHRVVILTPAKNSPTEIQLWGRVIRIGQLKAVAIVRYKTNGSHDQWRDSKQLDKAFMELVTRIKGDATQELLVELLNEHNHEVKEAHENQRRKRRDQEQVYDTATPPRDELIADTDDHPDDDRSAVEPRRSTRPRKQPERLAQEYLSGALYRSGKDQSTKKSSRARVTSSSPYEDEDDIIEGALTDETDSDDVYSSQDEESQDDNEVSDIDEDLSGLNKIRNFDDIEVETTDRQKKRKAFWRNTKEWIESYDQEEANEKALINFQPEKVYTKEDLADQSVLDRAVKLLFQARFGQDVHAWRISPHVKYDRLPASVSAAINQRMMADETHFKNVESLLDNVGIVTSQAKENSSEARAARMNKSSSPQISELSCTSEPPDSQSDALSYSTSFSP